MNKMRLTWQKLALCFVAVFMGTQLIDAKASISLVPALNKPAQNKPAMAQPQYQHLTVYNSSGGFAVFNSLYQIKPATGKQTLVLQVPNGIDVGSLWVTTPGISLNAITYKPGKKGLDAQLRRAVETGKIELLVHTLYKVSYTGVIVDYDGRNLVLDDGANYIYIDRQDVRSIAFKTRLPYLKLDPAQVTLEINVDDTFVFKKDNPKTNGVNILFVTNDLRWQSRYGVRLSKDELTFSQFSARAEMVNNSGINLKKIDLITLVSGDVIRNHQGRAPRLGRSAMKKAFNAGDENVRFSEAGIANAISTTVKPPKGSFFAIPSGTQKMFTLFTDTDVPVETVFSLSVGIQSGKLYVNRAFEFSNDKGSKLERRLPSGPLTIFNSNNQLVAELRISENKLLNSKIRLNLGKAQGIKGKSTILSQDVEYLNDRHGNRRVSRRTYEWEMILDNYRNVPDGYKSDIIETNFNIPRGKLTKITQHDLSHFSTHKHEGVNPVKVKTGILGVLRKADTKADLKVLRDGRLRLLMKVEIQY